MGQSQKGGEGKKEPLAPGDVCDSPQTLIWFLRPMEVLGPVQQVIDHEIQHCPGSPGTKEQALAS